jgi:hypothetical protein
MNRKHTLWHLRDAAEELQRKIRDLEDKPDYGYAEFSIVMQHLYHHMNTAWNARDKSQEQVAECSEADFIRWRQFPEDIYLGE